MKKTLILKLIESNDTSQIGNICRYKNKLEIVKTEDQRILAEGLTVIKPIAISDEEIKINDSYFDLSLRTDKYGINVCNSERLVELAKQFKDKFKKIELLPEHFSPEIKQLIVDGKLKDSDKIEIEYLDKFGVSWINSEDGFAIISIPESKESWDAVFDKFYSDFDFQISSGAFSGRMLKEFKKFVEREYLTPTKK